MRRGTLIINILFLALSGFLWWHTYSFPVRESMWTGPAGFPRLALILLMVFNFVSLLQNLKSKDNKRVHFGNLRYLVSVLVLAIVYVYLMSIIGYFIVTPLFFILMMRLLMVRSWPSILLVTAVFTVFVYITFYKVLAMPLPMGILS